MNSVFVKLRKKDARDSSLIQHEEREDTTTEEIVIRSQNVLAHNVDDLLDDSSGVTFFIQFLECSDKLNLIKFWIHVEGFKASFGQKCAKSSEQAENSLALLDAHNIYNKYIDADSSSSISLPKKVAEEIYISISEQKASADIFDEARSYVHSLFEFWFFKDFENSIFGKKYQLQVLSRRCSLGDILYVPGLLNALLEFVDDRHDQNCIQFLIACNTLEANYDSLPDEEAIEDAMSIYDKYFSMQALSPIEIGAAARQAMESEICSDGGRPARSSFCTAKQFCCLRIENRYLERFVQSPGYHTFLLELETEVRNTIELPRPNREAKCAGSSSSDSQPLFCDHHFEIPDFKRRSSGSSQFSPFLKRPNRSLNLAEVDCMGQYHVLYDDSLAQERTTPSRIRQKLRKYLDKSTLREEEVAAEVARTIIADVHSMVEAGRR